MTLIRTHFPPPVVKRLVLALLTMCLWLTSGCLQHATAGGSRIEWLGRPWELRYILYVTDDWQSDVRVMKKITETKGPTELDRQWDEHFTPQTLFPSRNKWAQPGEGLSAVLIEFDQDGRVKTPHSFGSPLFGKIDRLLYVTLTPGDYVKQPRFDFGEWFMGLGDISTHWAPGLCGVKTMPSPFAKTDTSYLYGPVFELNLSADTFGCREWAYQLQNPSRPYIDITSYLRKKDDPNGSGTYVREIFGWSRFSDPAKPVIGKHEADWYCFHECPGGDKPSLIPDIKAWAKKNGWNEPKRPTRIPVFPDPPAKSGTYPQ